MATQAQKMGTVKNIQAHLRYSQPGTTANEYMQEVLESVRAMVGSVFLMLAKGERKISLLKIFHKTPQMLSMKRL